MAKKKAENLVVQKSRPLFSLWQSELTLAEFKILDIYLSRINSHDPNSREVRFEKGELERIIGVTEIRKDALKKRLRHLMGSVVDIPDNEAPNGIAMITLFSKAVAIPDESGQWQINLRCTEEAMKYFFNIERLGYFRYKLRCIASLTSRYAYILFMYLESNRGFKKSWVENLDELKKKLRCDKEETYHEFKYFNKMVLKRAQQELFEKTECRFSYEAVKKGRSVVAIRFTLETPPALEEVLREDVDLNQITVEEWQNTMESKQKESEDELVMAVSSAVEKAKIRNLTQDDILSIASSAKKAGRSVDEIEKRIAYVSGHGGNVENIVGYLRNAMTDAYKMPKRAVLNGYNSINRKDGVDLDALVLKKLRADMNLGGNENT